jgi:hypothetical protein
VFGPAAVPAAAEAESDAGETAEGGHGAAEGEAQDAADEDDDDETAAGAVEKPGKACVAGHPGAATSNQTLLQWLPKCSTVAALWEATAEQKIQVRANDNDALVRVAYQCRTDVTWGADTLALAGRPLEEAFALENLDWCQHQDRKQLQLRIAKADEKDLVTLANRVHKRVQAKSFSKTDFALALLAEDPADWSVPSYIADGLRWLEAEIAPPESEPEPGADDEAGVAGEQDADDLGSGAAPSAGDRVAT